MVDYWSKELAEDARNARPIVMDLMNGRRVAA